MKKTPLALRWWFVAIEIIVFFISFMFFTKSAFVGGFLFFVIFLIFLANTVKAMYPEKFKNIEKDTSKNKEISASVKKKGKKKWWIVAVAVLFILIGLFGGKDDTSKAPKSAPNPAYTHNPASAPSPAKEIIKLTGEELGEYGRIVILNVNSDLPAEKYLYKVPAGKYRVTTDAAKAATVYIVKDEVQYTGSEKYPQELAYIGKGQIVTAGEELVKKGLASKEIIVTIAEDESILLVGKYNIFLEKVK